MERLEIKSTNGASSITFYEREPFDASKVIDYFTVRLTDDHLSASARVYASACSGLPKMFARVARDWQDFTGLLIWSTLEGELRIEVTHDGLGHFTIAAELCSGHYERDWVVNSSVMVETSQLNRLTSDVLEFLGRHE